MEIDQTKAKKDFYSPIHDVVFKMLFADEHHQDLLTAFLKSVLSLPSEEYEDVMLMDPHLSRSHLSDKLGILDVSIKLRNGKLIDVEIQLLPAANMFQRMLYYPAKLLISQVSKGRSYSDIKRVISVIITDFVFVSGSESYHNRFTLYDPAHGVEFSDLLEINTLELPKLPEVSDDTELWNWMRFINAANIEDLELLVERSPQMKEPVARLMELTDEERDWWNEYYREMAELDTEARERYLRNEVRAEIARKLLDRQMPIEEIADLTGFSVLEIKNLSLQQD